MSDAADELDGGADDDEITEIAEVIEDPDSYIQSQRLKDIFNARRDVRKRRLKMKTVAIDAEKPADLTTAKRGYRAAVENYLQEIRPLFMRDEQGKQVWFGLDFGTLEIPLPIEKESYGRSRGIRYVHTHIENGEKKKTKVPHPPEPKRIELQGLNYLFDLPEPITVTFDIGATSTGHYGLTTGTDNITKQHDIGFDRLDQIVNEANHRLEQRGLDLELNDGEEDSWEI